MADSLDSRVAQYVNGSDDSQVTNIAEGEKELVLFYYTFSAILIFDFSIFQR